MSESKLVASNRLRNAIDGTREVGRRLRTALPIIGIGIGLSSGLAQEADAQFLNRGEYPLWQREAYENYADISYLDYDIERERRTYDAFGAFMLDGVDLLRLEEYRTIHPFDGSIIFENPLNRNLFQNLVVVGDSYASWNTKLTVGRAVDAHFTPLTLHTSRLNGVRWDAATRRNRFSVVASRISSPLLGFGQRTRSFANYLYGGRWEGTVGGILTFGASYVNLHYIDSLSGRKKVSQKGNVPERLLPPQSLYVVVYDDSPGDDSGARVHDIALLVDGVPQPDIEPEIIRVADVAGQRELTLADIDHLRRYGSWLEALMSWRTFSRMIGRADPIETGDEDFLEASGTDVLVYRFDVPAEAGSAAFNATVSNDYSIDVAAPIDQRGVAGITFDDWHNVRRARGNPRNNSPQQEHFRYGLNTGVATYGADMKLDFHDLMVEAEYARNFSHFQYPVFEGRRSTGQRDAYFIAANRPFGRWNLGGEFFRMPATFATGFTYWRPEGSSFETFELVEDNDDRDQWPDGWEHWDPLDPEFSLDIVARATPEAKDNLSPEPNEAIGFGVFPGLDEDRDGTQDTNVNENRLPDYEEPFLMYYVDPDDFVFGDDFNNNKVVDARENDNLPDYPYELDSKGPHLFASYNPLDSLSVTVGYYDIEQIAGGGENRTAYTRVLYRRPLSSWGQLNLNYIGKRVRDNIPTSTYRVVVEPRVLENFSIEIRPDPLEMRNSLANTFFGRTRFLLADHLRAETILRFDTNKQFEEKEEDFLVQEEGTRNAWALVAKADYTYDWGPFSFMPMFKLTMQKQTFSNVDAPLVENRSTFPIVRLDYRASERTVIRAGLQGLPFFKHRWRNQVDPFEDFDARHWILVLQTRDNYVGYDLSFLLGFRSSRFKFLELEDPEGDPTERTSEMFLQIRVG